MAAVKDKGQIASLRSQRYDNIPLVIFDAAEKTRQSQLTSIQERGRRGMGCFIRELREAPLAPWG